MNLHQEIFSNCFFNFLLEVDRSIAAEVQEKGCYCGQKLDVGNFMRSGRGLPAGPKKELLRFSFCCRGDTCRKRVTPDSVRFMRGKTYVSVAILILSVVIQGASLSRIKKLREQIGVSRSTINRWIKWWHSQFAQSPFWRVQRGRVVHFNMLSIPASLLESFDLEVDSPPNDFLKLLHFLAPLRI